MNYGNFRYMIDFLWTNIDKVSSFATLAAALIALVAVIIAYQQVRIRRIIGREQVAADFRRDYLELAMKYPTFANPKLLNIDYEKETIEGDKAKFEQYEWFITMLLAMTEEILKAAPKKSGIRKNMELNIEYHKAYFHHFTVEQKPYLTCYDDEVLKLIGMK